MAKKFIQTIKNVQILCKTPCISQRKTVEKLCAKIITTLKSCIIFTFSQTFPTFFASLPTIIHPLSIPRLFHFSTNPITIIIKYI